MRILKSQSYNQLTSYKAASDEAAPVQLTSSNSHQHLDLIFIHNSQVETKKYSKTTTNTLRTTPNKRKKDNIKDRIQMTCTRRATSGIPRLPLAYNKF